MNIPTDKKIDHGMLIFGPNTIFVDVDVFRQ